VESNPEEQGWFVPHDIPGLVAQVGGKEKFIARLDDLFRKTPHVDRWNDYYNHSNEPVHLVPYLFKRVGAPWLTQKWVRYICENAYGDDAYGICGNEDVGQIPHVWADLKLDGVQVPKQIRYWGHYPIADLEFDSDAPVNVGMRAWSPFFPGHTKDSAIPGIVFEVHLRNTGTSLQRGTVAFSFPGPNEEEAGAKTFTRTNIQGGFNGVAVGSRLASYALGVVGSEDLRIGGELGARSSAWAVIANALPPADISQPGSSAAVNFSLSSSEEKVVRFIVSWHSPKWNGVGRPGAREVYKGSSGEPRWFSHMYAKLYPSAESTAQLLAKNHRQLLKRVLAWQQVIYVEKKLPVWLRDALINVLYLITEDGYWAQKQAPVPGWVKEEDGLFGLNECPRGCPQIECLPCSFYGSLPLS